MKHDQRGAAMIESVLLCILLLVPLSWGVAVMDRVHRAALASTAAVRDAGAEAVRSIDGAQASVAADRAVSQAFEDQDLDGEGASLRLSAPGGFSRGARIEVEVRYEVDVFGSWLPLASVPITARHAVHVPLYGSRDA